MLKYEEHCLLRTSISWGGRRDILGIIYLDAEMLRAESQVKNNSSYDTALLSEFAKFLHQIV